MENAKLPMEEVYKMMNERERKIYNSVKNFSIDKPALARDIQSNVGINKRSLAAEVRRMNEKYKGYFFIGSLREGYWLCRDEHDAFESMLGYNKIIMSMLGERKRMKEQILKTFPPQDTNLFGEPIEEGFFVIAKQNEAFNPFMER